MTFSPNSDSVKEKHFFDCSSDSDKKYEFSNNKD